MGGGGTMRTAAKLAGIGVARSGFRGSPASYPVEQSARNASRSAASSAGVSSQGARVAEVSPLHTAASGDLNDWEFADIGDLVMSAGEPVPRVVFGEVPTFQEAKEATAEMKEAIDQIYFSQSEGSSPGSEASVLSPAVVEPVTKSCLVEAISKPSVPKIAIQAFQLLSTSPEAQTVVASIACDPNIWKAVMENPAVTNFFESQLTEVTAGKVVESTNDAEVDGSETVETSLKEEKHESQSGYFFDFMGLLQNIKLTVTEMNSLVFGLNQTVVASTACDPNIWKAVMENPAVTNFFESRLTEVTAGKVVESTNDAAVDGSETVETSLKEEKHESQSGYFFDFMGLVQNVKLTVTEMVSRTTNFLQNIFLTAEKDNKSSADADGASFMDYKNIMGGTFMGLAVMAIMVVLMKRV